MEDSLPTDLRLLTLNCWGLKYISKLRPERLAEIGRRIASRPDPPHVVALQECWVTADYEAIRAETRHILPYGKFYYSGPFGGGLAILSRWPLEETSMLRYPLNGRPTAFWRGDWYVGKGVACARIRIRLADPSSSSPSSSSSSSSSSEAGREHILSIFNTHTHAPYTENQPGDTYLAHRLSQSWEMSKLLRAASERGHLALAMGDFNMRPLSLPHRIITAHAPVHDAWRTLHPDSSLGAADDPLERARGRPVPTADFNLKENGATSDHAYNTWRWPKEQQKKLGEGRDKITVPPDTPDRKGKRLDYIFFGSAPQSRDGDGGGGGTWVVRSARVGMVEPHPQLGCSLSDHFSVEVTLSYRQPRREPEQVGNDALLDEASYLQGPSGNSRRDSFMSANPLVPLKALFLPIPIYDDILSEIRHYTHREEGQRRWRAIHFLAWFAVLIACLIAVWFSPHNFISFILMLLSSLGLVAGVVDGLMSLLFFNSELRALKEFEWEISNARELADVDSGELEREKSF
ncbi:endonuclease/Exonuclease/phosphatase [Colletotrichum higginsianum IMI 349063]|uniref:Endonuclease/Exonuclease/phosphatase n=3 Tax=Colletotrichum higginsianum TaxID=80884 RepID=A0A1B7YVA0_COLHI|nr:endonuclease/Exonuclease/phosphatase [Colletotrichum higginsianum IMI 349063]OBR15882.1 endonuclease/Exonuclease/phosphatase [Colletotrichum higginsianum IMI 349063]TID05237.1 Inositol phosphosphingolipids phospholipase C [Colletotrichum higginsianum]